MITKFGETSRNSAELTAAEFRALQAVADGKVTRVYRARGNILRGPSGVSGATLWRLLVKKLICDGERCTGPIERRCAQVPTAAGRAILDKKSPRSPGAKWRE